MRIAIVLSLVAASAAADNKVDIKNKFAFDIMAPKKKCAKVTGALQKKLDKTYTCTAPTADSPGSASGKPIAATCETKGKKPSTFLLFAAEADCKEEREAQLANADGA